MHDLDEKKEAANSIVALYEKKLYKDICEMDELISACLSMWGEIRECFGYQGEMQSWIKRHSILDGLYKKVHDDSYRVRAFKFYYMNSWPITCDPVSPSEFVHGIEPPRPFYPRNLIRGEGHLLIDDCAELYERISEVNLIETVNMYVRDKKEEYISWLDNIVASNGLSLVDKIGKGFLDRDVNDWQKAGECYRLKKEIKFLTNSIEAGDAWAAFTLGYICFYGISSWGVRRKKAVECYSKSSKLLGIAVVEL